MNQLQQYTCPMHPEVIKNTPGKCPKCGMDLVPVKHETARPATEHTHMHAGHGSDNPPMGHAGHNHHAMMIADFRKRFYIVLILTVPVMLLSEMIQHWLGIHIGFAGAAYVLLLLSSIVFFYGGWPF